jgi:hypothetical protein
MQGRSAALAKRFRVQNECVLSDEVASALGPFFDRIGPSHDEIRTLIARAELSALDPEHASDGPIGKMKRVRGVLFSAVDQNPEGGERLVKSLVGTVRANGGFRAENENYPGPEAVLALQTAFRSEGCELTDDGSLMPLNLESLEGRELSEALLAYIRRARRGGWDAALVLGTAKSLEEAAARHIVKEHTGSYPTHADMPTTIYSAYSTLGLSALSAAAFKELPSDPRQAIQHAVCLLALAVNRFRNAEGEGHGRPDPTTATDVEASIVGLAAAIVTQLLLDADR